MIEDGSIQQYLTSATKPLGGMVPIGSSSGTYEAIYVTNQSTAKGVSLAYQNSDGSFTTVGEFGKSAVYINKTAYFLYNIQTNTEYGNRFAAVTHYRTTAFDSSALSYTAICAFGCGVAHSKPSAALEIRNYGDDTVQSRLDVYASHGEAMICLRGNRWGTVSNELELGKNIWFAGDMNARSFNVSSTEEIKENVTLCGSALDVLKSTSVYRYNLIPEPDVTVESDSIDLVELDGNGIEIITNEVPVVQSSPNGSEEPDEPKDSIGFIINEDTPEILLSEDGRHINLYTALSLNWKATQEILQRLEALEGSSS